MSEESSFLKKKFEEIEEEVKRLREPLESTLMDVRELISNLENPFNYATKILGVSEVLKKREDEPGADEAETVAPEEPSPPPTLRPSQSSQVLGRRELSTLLCAYLLLRILGREKALSFLNSRHARRLAPIELLESLADSVDLLSSFEAPAKLASGHCSREDLMLSAAYLVHSLAAGRDDSFFVSLCFTLKLLEHDSGRAGR